jgi:hypothetical protein
LMSSAYPVDTIWHAVLARVDEALAAIDLSAGAVWLLVERYASGVEVTRTEKERWRFAEALFAGRSLSAALQRVSNPEAPIWLAEHLAAGRFVGFGFSDAEHE